MVQEAVVTQSAQVAEAAPGAVQPPSRRDRLRAATIDEIIQTAGFRLERLRTGYMEGPKLLMFFYEGAAMPV